MIDLQTQIIAGAAALVIIGGLWLRLDAVSANLDACRADNRVVQQLHTDTVDQLAEASQLLADQVNEIAVSEQALEQARAAREDSLKKLQWAWHENSKLLEDTYTGSCIEWAQTPVCDEVLEQWSAEYQSYQQ